MPAACALLILLGLGCDRPPTSGLPAPPFERELLRGGHLSLEDLHGKTVLVDFWATWCPPCVVEIPELNAVWEAHRGTDVEILAISVDTDGSDALRSWVEKKGILYPVLIGDLDLAHAYGAEQFPYHLVISTRGEVVERLPPGYHDREELLALIERHRP